MSRVWFGSKWVLIGGAAIVLLVIVMLAAPFLIPVDSYRPLLVSAVESITGRQVQIDHLDLYLVPTVRIHVVNFRMKNPRGFPAGDALVAKSIDLGIAPRALLSRHLDITYIAPDGVQLNVLRDAGGRTNFAQPVPPHGAAPSRASIFTLERIRSVNVTDARITVADLPPTGAPVPSFDFSGVSGAIASIDTQAPDWANRLAIVADLRNARLTTALLTKPVEFHTGDFTFKSGAGRATFSASAGNLNLSGSAAFARLDPLLITFSVTAPELDFKELAMLVRSDASATATKARSPLARGTIKLGKVIFSPFEATDLNGQLSIFANSARLDACTFAAYGGNVREDAALTGSPGVPAAVSAQVHGLDAQRVLTALGFGTKNITGALDANFRLTTLLAKDPEQTLNATGTFAVRNGSFPGMDFKGQLAQAARILNLNVPSGDTRFSYFGGDLRIANERGYSNSLRLLSSGMDATLKGSFGFNQSLDYSGTSVLDALAQGAPSASSPILAAAQQILNTALQKDVGAASMTVPFALRGTLSNPQFSLAGIPQIAGLPSQQPASQQQVKQPVVQDLLHLIPGL